ncbi:energy transducer TonB [Parabacteroides sp. AF18-52]|uniref:energy transducer TonB family protein n=2 Tax=Parabacteroides TaxID=375288 RepID=UPI001F19DBE9|nr:energy transducer TonB [Parabacteroides sp. AF18-52]
MYYNYFITTIIILSFCSFSSSVKSEHIEEKYILIEGKSAYDSFNFKGKSTVIIGSLGMEFVTSYVKDEEYLRIESEPSNLLLKVQSKDTIIGEGFASGIYIKEYLWKQDQALRQKTHQSEPIETKQTAALSIKNKKREEEHCKKEPVINNRIAGAFGIGGTESNSQENIDHVTGNQGSPFGNSDHETNENVGGYGSLNLNGRSIGAGGLPRPAYTILKEGKIIINITVDPKGNVIFAEIGRGTNIDNASMRKSALDAAKRAKFNSISGANNQSGTITYVYKLK